MNDERDDLPPGLTPPPDEPLAADRKRELRERLMLDAQGGDGSGPRSPRRPGWVVPGLAAAAVLAVVGAGVYLSGGDGSDDSRTPLVPAASSTSSSTVPEVTPPATPSLSMTPDTIGPAKPSVSPPETVTQGSSTKAAPPPGGQPTAQNCADAVNEQIQYSGDSSLAGATMTASRPGSFGTTSLYETKSAWVVCDDFSAGDGGAPTLFRTYDKGDAYEPSTKTLEISQNTVGGRYPESWRYQYLAAGRDFDGVAAIAYTFPDGHTENAVVGQNGLWTMNYQPTDGMLAEPNTNFLDLPPIRIKVTYTAAGGGGTDTFTLPWASGTCGQTNHGC